MEKPLVLVVEDDNIIALDIKSRLKYLGYSAAGPVSSGEAAVLKARELIPNLVLMDIKLKGKIDGIEAAELINRDLDIPIVYLTAYADRATIDRAKIARPFGYILKPFDERDLNITIEMALYAHDMETALRGSELRFRSLFEASQDAIVATDQAGKIVLANRRAQIMFQKQEAELLESEMATLFSEQSRSHFQSTFRKRLEGKIDCNVDGSLLELAAVKSSSRTFPVEVALSAGSVRDDVFVLAIMRDVTVRKRSEKALREALRDAQAASQAKSAFLTNVTHEIRTPMNSILGMTELALVSGLNEEQREFLEMIKHAGDSLHRLLNSILELSKLESGKTTQQNVTVDLRSFLQDTVDVYARAARSKALAFEVEVAADVPDQLWGDVEKLEQVLGNLVGNAVKFTEEGGVSVQAQIAENMGNSGGLLQFTVSDSGVGIPADGLVSIFDAFTQVNGSYTRKFGGTGLGLALTKRIVAMMDGEIWAESYPGRGSAFHFTVPLVAAGGKPIEGIEATADASRSAPSIRLRARIGARGSQGEFRASVRKKIASLGYALDSSSTSAAEMHAEWIKRKAAEAGEEAIRKSAFKIVLSLRKGDMQKAKEIMKMIESKVANEDNGGSSN